MGEELRKPIGSYVLIKNPMTNEMAKKEAETLEKLPEDQRLNYLQEHYGNIWDGVEILAVGPECRYLKVGDKAIANGSQIQTMGVLTEGDKYIFVREGQFVGIC